MHRYFPARRRHTRADDQIHAFGLGIHAPAASSLSEPRDRLNAATHTMSAPQIGQARGPGHQAQKGDTNDVFR